ncbi:hypothetical protein N0V90_004732 [Kalmusia sp. IMI 367209]|nr:hypothetical protein N0V90_004732 [Kalmusia sp. IMI 367209]
MTIQVYSDPCTINCHKVLAALEEMKVDYKQNFIDYFNGQHKSEEFKKINPHATVPAATDGDLTLTESNAILQYAADVTGSESMYPKDLKHRADINRWLLWEASVWFGVCYVYVIENVVKPLKKQEPDRRALDDESEKFHKGAAILDKQLSKTKWLTGSNVTIADFAVAAPMHLHAASRLPIDRYPSVKRWLTEGMEQLESWKKTQGPVNKALLPYGVQMNGESTNGQPDKDSLSSTSTRAKKLRKIHEPGDAPVEITVSDGWPHVKDFDIDKNGFSLHAFHTSHSDWENDDVVRSAFYPKIISFLEQTLFSALPLCSSTDYTAESGPLRVRRLLPNEADDLLSRRVTFINVWKPINRIVEERPLAMCDVTSCKDEDFFKLILRYRDRTRENYVLQYSPGHKWWFFPKMTPEQVILLKTFDSEGDGRARFVGHTASMDPTNASENALASLTVHTPGETENILSMEKFDDMVTSVNCGNSSIEMTFEDDATFAYAQRVWDWVNGADNHSFVMVAGPGDCGTNANRIPFVVSTLQYDEAANKATLAAIQSNWTAIAHTYDLVIGSTGGANHTNNNTHGSPILPRDIDKDTSIDFNHDLTGSLSLASGDLSATVTCLNCSTTGSFDMQFKISQKLFVPTGASMTLKPKGVSAIAKMKLAGSGKVTDSLTKTFDLLSIPVSGLTIPGVFDLGPFLTIALGAQLTGISVTAGVTSGATGSLCDNAVLEMNLLDPSENTFSGWEPKIEVLETSVDGSISGGAQVFLQGSLELKATALGQGFRIGLDLKLPAVKATLTGVTSTAEVCPGSNQTVGVKAGISIGGSLGIKAFRESDESDPFLTVTLAITKDYKFSIFDYLRIKQIQSMNMSTLLPTLSSSITLRATPASKADTYELVKIDEKSRFDCVEGLLTLFPISQST